MRTGWRLQNRVKVPAALKVFENDAPRPSSPESQVPFGVPGKVPPTPEVVVWAILPVFAQRTMSPTDIEITIGLKNPTHGLGFPSHPPTAPTDT